MEERRYFAVNDRVLRDIDGMDFPAVVLAVQPNDRYRVEYLDDGNMEDMVPASELKKAPSGMSLPSKPPERVQRVAPGTDIPPALLLASEKREEERKHSEQQPRVVVHGTEEDDELDGEGEVKTGDSSYVLNGGGALPRGGGLKALRALRK